MHTGTRTVHTMVQLVEHWRFVFHPAIRYYEKEGAFHISFDDLYDNDLGLGFRYMEKSNL